MAWAVNHCGFYLKGSSKTIGVVTDHSPLVSIFSKSIFDLSTRLFNVRTAVMDHNLKVRWVSGKSQLAADSLGRNPVWKGSIENNNDGDVEMEGQDDHNCSYMSEEYKQAGLYEEELDDPMIIELMEAAKKDKGYQEVLAEVASCRSREELRLLPKEHPARSLSQQWDEMGVIQGPGGKLLIYQGSRLVVPSACRARIKAFLHLAHLGQKLTYEAGKLRYFWPSMREELFKVTASCTICATYAPSRQSEEEAVERYQPRQPMDLVATDMFQLGNKHYLLLVDVFSGYTWFKVFNKAPDTFKTCQAMNEVFLTFGYPKHLKADGGANYKAEFEKYCLRMYITPHRTSAYNSRSNGEAERQVGRLKLLMKKVSMDKGDMEVAFSQMRDAPTACSKMSAARIMFRRALRWPGLPQLPDEVDEVAAGVARQANKSDAKKKRNEAVSRYGRKVVELSEGLRVSCCRTRGPSCSTHRPPS